MNRSETRRDVAMRLLELGAGIRTKGFRLCIYCVEHMLFDAFGASEALSKSARDLGMGIKSAYKYVLTNALSAGKRIGRRFTPGEFLCFLAEYAAERAIKSDWKQNFNDYYVVGKIF